MCSEKHTKAEESDLNRTNDEQTCLAVNTGALIRLVALVDVVAASGLTVDIVDRPGVGMTAMLVLPSVAGICTGILTPGDTWSNTCMYTGLGVVTLQRREMKKRRKSTEYDQEHRAHTYVLPMS